MPQCTPTQHNDKKIFFNLFLVTDSSSNAKKKTNQLSNVLRCLHKHLSRVLERKLKTRISSSEGS
jgi:hypothetical protein